MNNTTKLLNYNKSLEEVKQYLQKLPDGKLKKRREFYNHVTKDGEIGITKNPKLIRLLRWKKYLLEREKQLDNNIGVLTYLADNLDSRTPIEIINSLSSAYKNAPITDFYHPSIADWLEEPYQKSTLPIKGRKYYTKKGVQVRSKSELLIANLLEEYNIPYRYEGAIILGGQTKFPDFLIKRPSDGKLIIWEHFGALNQPGYGENMSGKMELYMQHGFTPHETLIYTFEFDVGNPFYLQSLIENVILGI